MRLPHSPLHAVMGQIYLPTDPRVDLLAYLPHLPTDPRGLCKCLLLLLPSHHPSLTSCPCLQAPCNALLREAIVLQHLVDAHARNPGQALLDLHMREGTEDGLWAPRSIWWALIRQQALGTGIYLVDRVADYR